METAEGEPA